MAKTKSHDLGRCYISGPVTGRDIETVRKRFERVADSLERRGYVVINPLENGLPEHAPWKEHMAEDIANLLRCRAVYMLSDWKESHGARLEHAIARRCGLHVFYEDGNYA